MILFFLVLLSFQFVFVLAIYDWIYYGDYDTSRIFRRFVTLWGMKIPDDKDQPAFEPTTHVCLANHRSWSDIFIEPVYLGKYATGIARWMLAVAIPLSIPFFCLTGNIKLISRNKDSFRKSIRESKKEGRRIQYYPEGTRNPELKNLPLKPGGLKICYEEQLNIQIQFITNKQKLFSEKNWSCDLNTQMKMKRSEQIRPDDYETFDLFYKEVCQTWDEFYDWELKHTA